MGAAAGQISTATGARRRAPRWPLAVPVDITVLRSGIPDCVPGRSLDIGEGGLAAFLAGELRPGESVGVELRLPPVGLPLRTRAMVRHESRLRCGLEFLGLSPEQREMLRYWAQRGLEKQPLPEFTDVGVPVAETREVEEVENLPHPVAHRSPRRHIFRRVAFWTALAIVLACALAWWHWERGWRQLEDQLSSNATVSTPPRVTVPFGVMAPLLTHRVEPVFPEAARKAGVQGIVVLEVVLGQDGGVLHLRPVSGPSVLVPAAANAVKWWRFQPYLVDGEPAEVITTLAVEFRNN